MRFNLLTPEPSHARDVARACAQRDPYRDHQWLWTLFPAAPGTPRDFLFRRDVIDGLPRYHVVSRRQPGRPPAGWRIQSRDYAPALEPGERLSFDLRACATVRRRDGPATADRNARSRRHDVVMDAKRAVRDRLARGEGGDEMPSVHALVQRHGVAWLAQRGERHGFDLCVEGCVAEAYSQHRPDRAGEHELAYSTIDFRGDLVVRDPAVFLRLLADGIGSAKAFGCGLMLVRRPV